MKNPPQNWKLNSYFAAAFEECFKHANANFKGGGGGQGGMGKQRWLCFWAIKLSLESSLLYSLSACCTSVIMQRACQFLIQNTHPAFTDKP